MTKSEMNSYHRAWLTAHLDRTEAWLRERLAEGFDIHHLDGNHSTNDPANLVLIEHVDHMRLHGGAAIRVFGATGKRGPQKSTLRKGRIAYDAVRNGARWSSLHEHAVGHARAYAKHEGHPWPVERRKWTAATGWQD